jgi:hypothetical protein
VHEPSRVEESVGGVRGGEQDARAPVAADDVGHLVGRGGRGSAGGRLRRQRVRPPAQDQPREVAAQPGPVAPAARTVADHPLGAPLQRLQDVGVGQAASAARTSSISSGSSASSRRAAVRSSRSTAVTGRSAATGGRDRGRGGRRCGLDHPQLPPQAGGQHLGAGERIGADPGQQGHRGALHVDVRVLARRRDRRRQRGVQVGAAAGDAVQGRHHVEGGALGAGEHTGRQAGALVVVQRAGGADGAQGTGGQRDGRADAGSQQGAVALLVGAQLVGRRGEVAVQGGEPLGAVGAEVALEGVEAGRQDAGAVERAAGDEVEERPAPRRRGVAVLVDVGQADLAIALDLQDPPHPLPQLGVTAQQLRAVQPSQRSPSALIMARACTSSSGSVTSPNRSHRRSSA